ncbi:hypothetical protein C0J52_07156 [Blattella germanica]|nr:hypothetical protein C0J52_07156 [Blattella germanica]
MICYLFEPVTMSYFDERQAAINFSNAFCNILDNHRSKLSLYLADDAVLDWFGRTIHGKDSISGYLNLEVPQTIHTLTSVEPSGPIQHRNRVPVEVIDDDGNSLCSVSSHNTLDNSFSDDELAKPLNLSDQPPQVFCPKDDILSKINLGSLSFEEDSTENYKAECSKPWESQIETPINREISECYANATCEEGQGDCFPKPSQIFTEANRYLEARGSLQFRRTKINKKFPKNMKLVTDTMKWQRFCKLKIAYSTAKTGFSSNDHGDVLEDDFKIWLLIYQDNTRCRRNLSDAFDQVK